MTLIFRPAKLIAPCLLALFAACSPSGPPLTATDIVAVAPLPGRNFSAAYLTIHNDSKETITIHRVSSPDFAKVEIHESLIGKDIIQMRRLESITIDAGMSEKFESGGKHLMLIEPIPGLVAGKSITLQFEYNGDGMLIVTTVLINRE